MTISTDELARYVSASGKSGPVVMLDFPEWTTLTQNDWRVHTARVLGHHYSEAFQVLAKHAIEKKIKILPYAKVREGVLAERRGASEIIAMYEPATDAPLDALAVLIGHELGRSVKQFSRGGQAMRSAADCREDEV